MPTVSSAELTLTPQAVNDVVINVKYNVTFNVFERRLAALGLVFREQIRVLGVDPPGSTTGQGLASFPFSALPVTDGGVAQTIARDVSKTVPRVSLQEDPLPDDRDEIRCSIQIVAYGLPPAVTPAVFTDQEVLSG